MATLPNDRIRIFAYDIEGNDQPLSQSAAITRAQQFDIIVSLKAMYRTWASAMLTANPNLELAVYTNGTHSNNPPPYFAHDWYVWDASGKPVTSLAFPKNHLMNPRSGWKAYKENLIGPLLADSNGNAVYIDELGVGPIYAGGVSGAPLDPTTGKVWTWDAWMVQMDNLLDGYRAKLGAGVPVYCNGLGNGNRYFTGPTSTLLQHSDGALAESFLRGAAQAPDYYPSVSSYDREIAMMEAAGPTAWACTKIWSTSDLSVKGRTHRWSLGSFLLGAAPGAAWYFTSGRAATVTPWNPLWDTAKALGAPLGPRTGLFRAYQNGTVSVNNSTHDAAITLA